MAEARSRRAVLRETDRQAELRERSPVLRPARAAEFLGVKLQTLRNMTARRELACIRHGKKVLGYLLVDLKEWLDKHRQPAAE